MVAVRVEVRTFIIRFVAVLLFPGLRRRTQTLFLRSLLIHTPLSVNKRLLRLEAIRVLLRQRVVIVVVGTVGRHVYVGRLQHIGTLARYRAIRPVYDVVIAVVKHLVLQFNIRGCRSHHHLSIDWWL